MKEVKGSYLLWSTIGIYLLYLFLDFIEINILRMLILVIVGLIFLGLLCLLIFSQLYIPLEYGSNYEYDKKYYKDLKYKTYYSSIHCSKHGTKWVRFSLIYWIVVVIIEINTFSNKYFTFKF